jgi:hypothetical protein
MSVTHARAGSAVQQDLRAFRTYTRDQRQMRTFAARAPMHKHTERAACAFDHCWAANDATSAKYPRATRRSGARFSRSAWSAVRHRVINMGAFAFVSDVGGG